MLCFDSLFSLFFFAGSLNSYLIIIFIHYFGVPGMIHSLKVTVKYRQTSNIYRILVGNKIVDHSDVVGASPVGAVPTISSFSTYHIAAMDSAKTTASRDGNISVLWFAAFYIISFVVIPLWMQRQQRMRNVQFLAWVVMYNGRIKIGFAANLKFVHVMSQCQNSFSMWFE